MSVRDFETSKNGWERDDARNKNDKLIFNKDKVYKYAVDVLIMRLLIFITNRLYILFVLILLL